MADPVTTMTMIGTGLQAGQGIASGVAGKKAANEAKKAAQPLQEAAHSLLGTGLETVKGMQDTLGMFGSKLGTGTDLLDMAMTNGASYTTAMNDLANQALDAGPSFDFTQGKNTIDQAMAGFKTTAEGMRNTALEKAGLQTKAGLDSLDAVLASRGVSRGSGVGSAAVGEMLTQANQGLVGLERDLAAQGAATALDATKFDIGRVLQEQQMGSQFELGRAGQVASNIGLAGDLMTGGYQNPLAMAQNMYTANVLNPYMQTQSGLLGTLGMGTDMLTNISNMFQQQSAAAGSGKGAGLGGAFDPERIGMLGNSWPWAGGGGDVAATTGMRWGGPVGGTIPSYNPDNYRFIPGA